ncbi:MAG TPA: aminotransferase class IV [Puia sp.]|nr:aminotransferase class IV [Puia sp.]
MYTFLNDKFLPATDATLGVNDLAIQRGYGIFDFFKTVGDKPIFLDDHLDRFFHSASRMRLDPGKTRDELTAILAELRELNRIPDSGVRITLTGGISTDSITPGRPNLVITQFNMPAPGKACPPPIRLISYPHQRQLPDVKTIDYLMAIYLQPHIRDRGASDVLYQRDGIVTECPRCNFFLVTALGTLVTPNRNILNGVTRKHILTLAADAGIPLEERDVHLDELATAREAFITSTSRHIVPVSHVDDIPIGVAHPVATTLTSKLHHLVNAGN